jgi:hypothetical protein
VAVWGLLEIWSLCGGQIENCPQASKYLWIEIKYPLIPAQKYDSLTERCQQTLNVVAGSDILHFARGKGLVAPDTLCRLSAGRH